MRRLTLPLITGWTLLAAVIAPSAAQAGVRDSRGVWAFDPETYRAPTRQQSRIADPVTLLFMGGGGAVTYNRVARHLEEDFELDGPLPFIDIHWRTRRRNPLCQGPQYMYFLRPDYVGDGEGFTHWAFTGSTNALCASQYHGRFWTDHRHATRSGHARDVWVAGGVHHERLRPGHKIDMDWSVARRRMVTAMRTHCSDPRFGLHPGARTMYQGFHHDRVVARISMRHRAEGCEGA